MVLQVDCEGNVNSQAVLSTKSYSYFLFCDGYAGGLAPCWRGSYVEFLNVQSTLSNELFLLIFIL